MVCSTGIVRITSYFTTMMLWSLLPAYRGTAPDEQTISGYSSDFTNKECIATYFQGSSFAKQPEELKDKPMSLWSLALEVHTGRIYAGALGSFLFIFVIGILIIFTIVSGKKA